MHHRRILLRLRHSVRRLRHRRGLRGHVVPAVCRRLPNAAGRGLLRLLVGRNLRRFCRSLPHRVRRLRKRLRVTPCGFPARRCPIICKAGLSQLLRRRRKTNFVVLPARYGLNRLALRHRLLPHRRILRHHGLHRGIRILRIRADDAPLLRSGTCVGRRGILRISRVRCIPLANPLLFFRQLPLTFLLLPARFLRRCFFRALRLLLAQLHELLARPAIQAAEQRPSADEDIDRHQQTKYDCPQPCAKELPQRPRKQHTDHAAAVALHAVRHAAGHHAAERVRPGFLGDIVQQGELSFRRCYERHQRHKAAEQHNENRIACHISPADFARRGNQQRHASGNQREGHQQRHRPEHGGRKLPQIPEHLMLQAESRAKQRQNARRQQQYAHHQARRQRIRLIPWHSLLLRRPPRSVRLAILLTLRHFGLLLFLYL